MPCPITEDVHRIKEGIVKMTARIASILAIVLSCASFTPSEAAKSSSRQSDLAQSAATTVPASAAASLQQGLSELKSQVGRLPEGLRRARFRWVCERLSYGAEEKKAGDDWAGLVDGVLAALQQGKQVSDAVPWFDRDAKEGLRMFDNGRIGLAFVVTRQGISLESLFDLQAERELLSGKPASFWSLTLSDTNGKDKSFSSEEGFKNVRVSVTGARVPGSAAAQIEWQAVIGEGAGELRAKCSVCIAGEKVSWRLSVDNSSNTFTIRKISFPTVSLGKIGDSEDDDFLLVPHGSGELRATPIRTKTEFSGRYPGGWCSMQFLGHYDPDCGLYLATHDPFGSTKDVKVTGQGGSSLETSITWPAPDSGVPGNDWECPGEAVLQAFRGDWFDAAQIYKRWASEEAKWWPGKSEWGRSDTPGWLQETAVWAQTGGSPEQVVGPVKKFAEYMGVPTALHWYNWHVVPFDDDYPHYFPYKKGVPEGVKALQDAGVRVMPYINGRLWDTDLDDFKNNAIRFCTKDEKGKPYIETYGSGQKLCPMCPTTELWQKTVQDLVLRLVSPEVNVDAVYVDQVAAATPALCFDRTHGHPLAGGHWWNTMGYWPMLTELQSELSRQYPEKVLTTECNAEPYVHVFDGYLTWHFQYQNQIPLFAAVYGGKVQLFSRAYQGDSWKGLAMRMKTGQALVFGEQLGWISPRVISDPEAAAFLRRMARFRYALRDYLARGEMARPPVLEGDIPTVTADWQWWGKRLVTTPAILSGAWRAKDGRLALIFVNVSDQAQEAQLEFDADKYGLADSAALLVTSRTETAAAAEPDQEKRRFRRLIRLKPHDALALKIATGE